MFRRTLRAGAGPVAAVLAVALASVPPAAGEKAGPADPPHDLIVALDVSDSMVVGAAGGKGNDPQGIRWDGLQFLIDTARDEDRLSLVLFGGDAAVPTQKLGDRSGFLQMGAEYDHPRLKKKVKGRQLLKDLVGDLQQHEARRGEELRANPKSSAAVDRFYTFDDLPTLGETFVVHNYTSVVETLNTITTKAELLDALRPAERQAWLLLFTDGKETADAGNLDFKEKGHQFPTGPKDYAYRKELKAAGGRQKVVEPHLKLLRSKQVRAFTFALGDDCDEKLLRAITDGTNPRAEAAARRRIGAYYNPRTNTELLSRLQEVCWELRQYWVLTPLREKAAGQDRFLLPEPGPWLELGVMLYRKPATAGGRASAPGKGEVTFNQGGALKDLAPLTSRSHAYYRFDRGDRALNPNRILQVTVGRSKADADSECVGAVRTEKPLFLYREPATGSAFTPLDAIPLEVEFLPYAVAGRFPFAADQFEVEAVLIPAGGNGRKSLTVPLKPEEGVAAGKPVRFRGEVILDEAPTRRNTTLLGRYEVEVVVRGKGTKGPLAGARRHLIRATIEVKDYPILMIKESTVRLTNGGGTPKARVQVDVPGIRLGRRPGRVVGRLGATLSGTWRRPGSPGTLGTSKAKLAPAAVELRGGKGTVEVTLAPAALSGLAPGEYPGGAVALRASWGAARAVDLTLVKSRWKLEAPARRVVFDFSGRRDDKLRRKWAGPLKGGIPAEETVWLSTSKDPNQKPGDSLALALAGGGTTSLPVEGLARRGKLGPEGLARGENALDFTLHRRLPNKLPFGTHRATLYLVGPAIEAVEVPVEVRRHKFKLSLPAPQVAFDLSEPVRRRVVRPIEVRLDTDLDTDEEVWLSESKEGTGKPAGELTFDPVSKGKGKPLRLPASGLGKKVLAVGKKGAKSDPLSLALERPGGPLPGGRYDRKLWLVGEAIEPYELNVRVIVDEPVVYLLDAEGKAERLDQLSILGPAGSSIRCTLRVDTELKGKSKPAWYTRLAEQLRKAPPQRLKGDELPVGVKALNDQMEIELAVPASVHEGDFRTRLQMNLAEAGAAPLLLDFPLHVRVAHRAAHLAEPGPLRLDPGTDPALRATRDVTLTTPAPPGQVVRWSVERVAQPAAGLFRALELSRLDVRSGARSVVQEKAGPAGPNTPLKGGEKAALTVAVNCAGLAPGYYRAALRFRSVANQAPLEVAGFSDEVQVEVTVPGRQVTAELLAGPPPVAGTASKLRVVVTSYGCEVGKGQVFAVDDGNRRLGDPVAIDARGQVKPAVRTRGSEGVQTAEFVVPLLPTRAGRNNFAVVWPRYLKANSGETGASSAGGPNDQNVVPVSVVALGRLSVLPAMAALGEEVTVRAVIDPATIQEASRFALTGTAPDGQALEVELEGAAERGVYTGKYRIGDAGIYKLLGTPGGQVPLQAAEMRGSFALERPTRHAEMLYGGGGVMRLLLGTWRSNLEEVTLPQVARLTNKESARCEWEARLLYPKRETDAQNILQLTDLDNVEAGPFDAERHLAAKLVVEHSEGESGRLDDWHQKGVLKNGQELVLAVESRLPEAALEHLYHDRAAGHQALDRLNGLLVELRLKWLDDENNAIGERALRVPVAVQTQNWKLQGLLYGLLDAGLLSLVAGGAWWGYRRLRPRKERSASEREETGRADRPAPPPPPELPPGWEE